MANHPNGRSPPFFLTPRGGHGARARPFKGGVKTRGTFPIWVIRHLCQQFQSQGLNIKTASKAERKSILERFCVRNEMKPESVTYTVLPAERNGTRKAGEYIYRSSCGAVLPVEPFCARNKMEPEKQASIYR